MRSRRRIWRRNVRLVPVRSREPLCTMLVVIIDKKPAMPILMSDGHPVLAAHLQDLVLECLDLLVGRSGHWLNPFFLPISRSSSSRRCTSRADFFASSAARVAKLNSRRSLRTFESKSSYALHSTFCSSWRARSSFRHCSSQSSVTSSPPPSGSQPAEHPALGRAHG